MPRLIVVAGRPGTGKTTLARALSERMGAAYLRVDAVETALRRIQRDGPCTEVDTTSAAAALEQTLRVLERT